MGQHLNVISDAPAIAKTPAPRGLPQCPKTCVANHALTGPQAVSTLPGGRQTAPDASNISA